MIGDLLSACFDANLAVWAAAATEIEDQAVRWVAEFLGYPAARRRVHERRHGLEHDRARGGARACASRARDGAASAASGATLYCSDEAHYSIERAAEILGLGSENVRSLPIDGDRRLPPEAVAEAIRADRAAGRVPSPSSPPPVRR